MVGHSTNMMDHCGRFSGVDARRRSLRNEQSSLVDISFVVTLHRYLRAKQDNRIPPTEESSNKAITLFRMV
jgi:hypothetical protein